MSEEMSGTGGSLVNERLDDVLARLRHLQRPLVHGPTTVALTGITHDSRAVTAGSMFCCVPGEHADGHEFGSAAVAAGASALLVERVLDIDVTQVVVADVRQSMGFFAAAFYRHPTDGLTVVGVTGTNGKTTTTHLLASIFDEAGRPAGVIGTLTAARTTPESTDLQRILRSMADSGKTSVMMEVSSHALVLQRLNGCRFAAAVFTNLGHDHLDLHGTQERYFAAKALLFQPSLAAVGVVNVDDIHGRLLADAAPIPIVTFAPSTLADVTVTAGSHQYLWNGRQITVPLGARFNVDNSLAAATTAMTLGVDVDTIAGGLAKVSTVPGRFQSIDAGQRFSVVVDYAHTPDGLSVALRAAREIAGSRRVIVVFGCGGDRDSHKRAPMGETAARLADVAIVTSDNPRSEQPMSIIEAVVGGVPAALRDRIAIYVDRHQAIEQALAAASEGDVVVIAGKGHEATQTMGNTVNIFDDTVVAREILESYR
jgi:UDP-N-acetylmuramoyl-L-alanyl-D-glutamate--2,6-diaminopimelate ligase